MLDIPLINLQQRFGSLPETHYVPDILAPDLKIVFVERRLGFNPRRKNPTMLIPEMSFGAHFIM